MTISQAKRQARVAEWIGKIEEQQSSGLTVKAWCAAQGLCEGRFYYWLKLIRELAIEHRIEETAGCAALIRVKPESLASAALSLPRDLGNREAGIVIRHGNASVELPQGTAMAVVAELLKALSVP